MPITAGDKRTVDAIDAHRTIGELGGTAALFERLWVARSGRFRCDRGGLTAAPRLTRPGVA
jgi:hypothetical protein